MESPGKFRSSVCVAPDKPQGSELCSLKAAPFSEEIKMQTHVSQMETHHTIHSAVRVPNQIRTGLCCKTTNLQEARRSAEHTGKTMGMPLARPRDDTSIGQRTLS